MALTPRVLVLIPARYGSTRFPGKPLTLLNDRPMIVHVLENVKAGLIGLDSKVVVVTDDDRIHAAISPELGEVARINDNVSTGTERILLAYERYYAHEQWDLIVNVQGDEPLLSGEILKSVVEFHLKSSFDVATLLRHMPKRDSEFLDPNRVKAAYVATTGACLYFSRASIPFDREGSAELDWHLHIGLYSFRPQVLRAFGKLPEGKLESLEKLEQLRLLENGYTIGASVTNAVLGGVDSPSDVAWIEGVLRDKNKP